MYARTHVYIISYHTYMYARTHVYIISYHTYMYVSKQSHAEICKYARHKNIQGNQGL